MGAAGRQRFEERFRVEQYSRGMALRRSRPPCVGNDGRGADTLKKGSETE